MRVIQKKICLLGHFAVGKTSLTRRFVEDRFDENYLGTIGIHLSNKSMIMNGDRFELFVWDLAGGEKFNQVGPQYLLGAVGALVVCDVTNQHTFDVLGSYAKQLQMVNPDAKFVFVGNKIDLTESQVVSREQIQTVGDSFGGSVILTSAKDGLYVEDAFRALVEQLEL